MKFWALLIAGAVSPFLFTSTLPDPAALGLLAIVALTSLKPSLRLYGLLPAFFLLTTLSGVMFLIGNNVIANDKDSRTRDEKIEHKQEEVLMKQQMESMHQ